MQHAAWWSAGDVAKVGIRFCTQVRQLALGVSMHGMECMGQSLFLGTWTAWKHLTKECEQAESVQLAVLSPC